MYIIMNSLFLILILIFATTKIKDKNICKCVYGVIAILIFNQLYDGYCNFVQPTGYTMVGTDSTCGGVNLNADNVETACNALPGCFYDIANTETPCRPILPTDKISSEQLRNAYQCTDGGTPGEPQAYLLDGAAWSADMTLSGQPLDNIPETCNNTVNDTSNILTLASCTPISSQTIGTSCVGFQCPANRPIMNPAPTNVAVANVDNCCQPESNTEENGSNNETCAQAKARDANLCGPNGFKYDTSLFTATQHSEFNDLLINNGDLHSVAGDLSDIRCKGPVCDLDQDKPDFEECCKSQMPCYLHFKALESSNNDTKIYINDTGMGIRTGKEIGSSTDLISLSCPGQKGRGKIDGKDYENISIPAGFNINSDINASPITDADNFSDIWQEIAGKLCKGSTCNFNNDDMDLNTCCTETINCREDVLNKTNISNWFKPELLDPESKIKLTYYLTGFDQEDGTYQELSSLDDLCLDPLQTNPSLRAPSNIMDAEENVRKHLRRFKSEYPPFDKNTGMTTTGANISVNKDFFNNSICGSGNSETDNFLSRSHITNDDILSQCCDTALIIDEEDDIDPTETSCGPVLKVIGT